MDELQKLLAKTKPSCKQVYQREQIAQNKKQSLLAANELQRKEEERSRQRQEQLHQFYHKQSVKRVKMNEVVPLSMLEVKESLRSYQQPVTLFGESEDGRYKRLLRIRAYKDSNPDFVMSTYDEDFEQKRREQEQFTELDNKYRERLIEPQLGDDPAYLRRKRALVEAEKEPPATPNVCDELYLWLHKVLRDWARALDQKYAGNSIKGAAAYARFNETVADFQSFFTALRRREGDREMLVSMRRIMNYALLREYHKVNDAYILLTIGTAPWPMGVAMLGITVKKNAHKVSHVLTDEVSRRWMQSLKRVITVSQQLYPSLDHNEAVLFSINSTL